MNKFNKFTKFQRKRSEKQFKKKFKESESNYIIFFFCIEKSHG